MLKKILLIVLVLSLALCPLSFAEGIYSPFEGEGTAESPYLISSVEELLQFASIINAEKPDYDYLFANYQLTADIALNDCADFDIWNENPPANVWTPIGYHRSFRGVFDGSGHTISGLYINQTSGTDEFGRNTFVFGLFGSADGEIRDLHVKDAYICPVAGENSPPFAGIIAGNNYGLISGCTAEGVVISEGSYGGGISGSCNGEIENSSFAGKIIDKGFGSIGGIAGSAGNIRDCSVSARLICDNPDDGLMHGNIGGIVGGASAFMQDEYIENCRFEGEIISGSYAGGIIGHAGSIGKSDTASNIFIRNCTNEGSISAASDAGGIAGVIMVGSNTNGVQLENCINRGEVNTLSEGYTAAGGIAGYIDTRNEAPVIIADCSNEAELRAYMPGGIVGRLMQSKGNVQIKKCTNKGAIIGEGSYAGGILCHIQQLGEKWNILIDECVNEADITASANAGGIVCFALDLNPKGRDRALTISNCTNRGNLRSDGTNNFMGGILGVDALAKVPVTISGCSNEGDLEYTAEMKIDAETLSGALIALSRTSGGIVGYVGAAPYLSLHSGERTRKNINVKKAYLNIADCSSTGSFIHNDAAFADDVDETLVAKWQASGYENVLNFFMSLEGGIVGTIADDKAYSVSIDNCTYENIEREIDDWNRYDIGKSKK